ncbi:MAG: anaerobic ribonucleoside-triphosphate reductase activating protein [Clostridia bacterium]|nr:anaerobic ribonucleoside-triphosphate reductase activating protein [Clostridia bacterium]
MKLCGLQKTTLLDYPGKVACTVFTGGCNFRCPFCQNAGLVVDLSETEEISTDTFFAFLKKRKGILDGVCVSGGEPLLQPDIFDFLREIKALGYSVKFDTNGAYPEKLKKAVDEKLVDCVAMDIKNSLKKYPQTVGIENFDVAPIIESVEFLKSGVVDFEFRTTVVKDFHEKSDFYEIGEWLKGAPKYFLQCFIDSEDVICKGLSSPDKTDLEQYAQIMAQYCGKVDIRGI